MIIFQDDDAGFAKWQLGHADVNELDTSEDDVDETEDDLGFLMREISESGFVVCCERKPKNGQTILHLRNCIHAYHYKGRNSTRLKKQRVCSDDAIELYWWAERNNVSLAICKACEPLSQVNRLDMLDTWWRDAKYFHGDAVPSYTTYYPSIYSMDIQQAAFYRYFAESVRDGVGPVVNGNIGYLFLFARDTVLRRDVMGIKSAHVALKFLAETYEQETKFAHQCRTWALDCLLEGNHYKEYLLLTDPVNLSSYFPAIERLNVSIWLGKDVDPIDICHLTKYKPRPYTIKHPAIFKDCLRHIFSKHSKPQSWSDRLITDCKDQKMYRHDLFSYAKSRPSEYINIQRFQISDEFAAEIKIMIREAQDLLRDTLGGLSAKKSHNAQLEDEQFLITVRPGKAIHEYAIPKPSTVANGTSIPIFIDHSLVRQKEAESAQISSLLADIFTDEVAPGALADDVFDATVAAEAAQAGSLDARHAALLRALLAKDSWTNAEFEALARAENLLPNAAVDTINEAAFELFEEPVLDGDDVIYISIDLAKEMLS